LSDYILGQDGSTQGFSARNLWRMKSFYESYKDQSKLSAMLTEIGWSNHLHILSKTKTLEEKEFYLQLASKNRYTERDFARIIDSCTFERTLIADKKLSAALTEFPASGVFKDSYVFEFVNLPEKHKEKDLQKALVANLKQFLLELGPDFTLIKDEFPLQVGMRDFKIDILLHSRVLNNLVAIELKIDEFQPEYLGKLQFYLEALDRDVRKPHENPSIGILICKSKDEEVVKYALSKSTSPAVIAEYETKLINKEVLMKKLHELSLELENVSEK
jgi:predicted nuclease of restriction endonuclease-like (RecB) superfamily